MLDSAKSLPEDPDELRRFTALLLAEVKSQAMLIEKLRHQLAGHRSHRFGPSSETIDQLQLALEASEIAVAKMTAKLRLPDEEKDKPKRRPIPGHIPRQEIELTTGDDGCGHCGGTLRRLGEDVTEELEYAPGRFIVNRIVRPRMVCSGCEAFSQAPLPSRPIERGRPGPGLLAHVLVSKYADHLPLYRQSQIFEREGLDLDRSTLADWVGKSTALLEPLADAIGRHVLAGQAIGQLANLSAATPIREGRLVPVLLDHMSAHIGVHVYYGSRAAQPRRVRAFLDLAIARLLDSPEFVLSNAELRAAARR